MAPRLFGTDGVRGIANVDLTAELAFGIAASAVRVLHRAPAAGASTAESRPTVVVGRDTRPSGEFLEAAVVAGLASEGADVLRLGVVPTPAVAYAVAASGASLGVMLSASHNPMPDNGIKLFARGGHKLADSVEDEIEARIGESWHRPTGARIGRVRDLPDAGGIENRKILEKADALFDLLNAQSAQLHEWRRVVVGMLLLPLVDGDEREITGDEYEDSTKNMDEL